MFKDWRGFARSAALVASGGLVVFCVLKLLPGRTPRVESQVNFGFAEPFALPIPAPPTSSEKFSVSFSLAVRCNYTEVEALPYLLESISMQTVLPDETVVVLTQTLEDGLGETLMDLAFGPPDAKQKTGRTDLHVTQDELTSMSLQEIAAKVKNGTQPIELSVRLIPNLKFVMRAGHYSPDVDGLFAVSQTRNTTDLISVIDCNDYLHPKRTELIAKVSLRHEMSPERPYAVRSPCCALRCPPVYVSVERSEASKACRVVCGDLDSDSEFDAETAILS